jgi:hypothetical protein
VASGGPCATDMTAFRSLGQALTALVGAAASLAGGPCTYEDTRPTERDFIRAIRVAKFGVSECTVADVAKGPRDWRSPFDIELQARERTVDAADEAVDTLLGEVFEILAASGVGASLNLGVIELLVTPSIEWQSVEAGDFHVAGATLRVQVTHRTQGATLTPWN